MDAERIERIERVKALIESDCEQEEAQAQKSRNPEAALALYDLMSGLSELCWCAGWMTGWEYSLWMILQSNRLVEKNRRAGQHEIERSLLDAVERLARIADGWWIWGDDVEWGATFLSTEEWNKEYLSFTSTHSVTKTEN